VGVDWGRADAEYIKTFAIFYSTLLGTITPRNAEYVADRLSGMTAAAAYPLIRKSILSVAKDPSFAGSGSTTNFVSNQVVYEPESGLVFVTGDYQVYSGFGQPKIISTVYEMSISIIEGRPVVLSATNYPGTQAHTIEWKIANPAWNKTDSSK
jgi:conjugal transfer pilus assembly protein TraE